MKPLLSAAGVQLDTEILRQGRHHGFSKRSEHSVGGPWSETQGARVADEHHAGVYPPPEPVAPRDCGRTPARGPPTNCERGSTSAWSSEVDAEANTETSATASDGNCGGTGPLRSIELSSSSTSSTAVHDHLREGLEPALHLLSAKHCEPATPPTEESYAFSGADAPSSLPSVPFPRSISPDIEPEELNSGPQSSAQSTAELPPSDPGPGYRNRAHGSASDAGPGLLGLSFANAPEQHAQNARVDELACVLLTQQHDLLQKQEECLRRACACIFQQQLRLCSQQLRQCAGAQQVGDRPNKPPPLVAPAHAQPSATSMIPFAASFATGVLHGSRAAVSPTDGGIGGRMHTSATESTSVRNGLSSFSPDELGGARAAPVFGGFVQAAQTAFIPVAVPPRVVSLLHDHQTGGLHSNGSFPVFHGRESGAGYLQKSSGTTFAPAPARRPSVSQEQRAVPRCPAPPDGTISQLTQAHKNLEATSTAGALYHQGGAFTFAATAATPWPSSPCYPDSAGNDHGASGSYASFDQGQQQWSRRNVKPCHDIASASFGEGAGSVPGFYGARNAQQYQSQQSASGNHHQHVSPNDGWNCTSWSCPTFGACSFSAAEAWSAAEARSAACLFAGSPLAHQQHRPEGTNPVVPQWHQNQLQPDHSFYYARHPSYPCRMQNNFSACDYGAAGFFPFSAASPAQQVQTPYTTHHRRVGSTCNFNDQLPNFFGHQEEHSSSLRPQSVGLEKMETTHPDFLDQEMQQKRKETTFPQQVKYGIAGAAAAVWGLSEHDATEALAVPSPGSLLHVETVAQHPVPYIDVGASRNSVESAPAAAAHEIEREVFGENDKASTLEQSLAEIGRLAAPLSSHRAEAALTFGNNSSSEGRSNELVSEGNETRQQHLQNDDGNDASLDDSASDDSIFDCDYSDKKNTRFLTC
ncbi:unnamed protein product [Amoebophrya sp. A120]|nr:unnamed protein product [Amoebophrya sp. A120]|eukprot:GSA120T00024376001.1